jgi:RNA polymerase sigma-B factor
MPVARARSTEQFLRWRRSGDRRARAQLIERFLPLARKLAHRYRGGAYEPFDDLVQVASLGLVKAVDRFDPDRGTSFTSFAVPTILGELKRYFRDSGWCAHVPRGAQELALRVQEAEHALSERIGRSPTAQQIAQYLEISVEDVVDGLEAAAAHHATSIDAPHQTGGEEAQTLAEVLGEHDERLELVEASAAISAAAAQLAPHERRVLALRFNEDLTQTEIARRVGVSQMQVSRILRSALAKLRELTEQEPTRPHPGPP